MNYRHAFHAGNFADVFKHAILLALLDALTAKDKSLCCLDTHAGRGRYALYEVEAGKTGEWRDGIGRLFDDPDPPVPLQRYLDAIRACNPDGALRTYPGSPLLAARTLRANDRLILCEVQDDEAAALRALFHRQLSAGPFAEALVAELLVRPDDSPLRLNGCGMLIANPPWQFDAALATLLPALRDALAQSPRAAQNLHWLRRE